VFYCTATTALDERKPVVVFVNRCLAFLQICLPRRPPGLSRDSFVRIIFSVYSARSLHVCRCIPTTHTLRIDIVSTNFGDSAERVYKLWFSYYRGETARFRRGHTAKNVFLVVSGHLGKFSVRWQLSSSKFRFWA